MSRNRKAYRKHIATRAPPTKKRKNVFLRHWKEAGVLAGSLAAGHSYKAHEKGKLKAGKESLQARGDELGAKGIRIAKDMYIALKGEGASKEEIKIIRKANKAAEKRINENRGEKEISMAGEFDRGLRGDGGQLLIGNRSYEVVMEHAKKEDENLLHFNVLWKEEAALINDRKWLYPQSVAIAGASALVLALALNILERRFLRYRFKVLQENWEAEKAERERKEHKKREERARKKEEKRRMREEKRRMLVKGPENKVPDAPNVSYGEPRPKRKRITKNELKKRVACLLEPEFGEDSVQASKLLYRNLGRETCKKIIDDSDNIYEIIGEYRDKCSESGIDWIMDRISGDEYEVELEESNSSYEIYSYCELDLPVEAEKAIKEKGLDVDHVKLVIVNGFNLHAPKRAIGRVYHREDLLKKRIDQELSYENPDPGKEREEILGFLKSHGVVSTYKQAGRCIMINTVPGFGRSQPVTALGEQILKATVDWIVEFKKRHQA
ncbi:hypothetical protein GF412_04190 [Candidatus Micrarchaeota archaeon]|nr:hypothetical protein [Candidatus Micrarchaeota archaeon]MBD3418150.1 hypothetical protein [Candidatus Micrarchaeota archaeon]